MAMTWLLLVPLALAVTAHASGWIAPKLGVALTCAGILLADLLRNRPSGPNRPAGWVVAALILSAIGDAFLSYRGGRDSFFLAGIAFSDTLISFHEFLHFNRWSGWILPTYYLAHLCLAWSLLKAAGRRAFPAPDRASGLGGHRVTNETVFSK
jgi:uncharacterized membrane protein YhhN